MAFVTIAPTELRENVFDQIKLGMPLLTVSDGIKTNTMTVNWGEMGYLWNRCVTTVFVRPQRYTLPILEAAGGYSLCFMGKEYSKEVAYCGKVSGSDENKIAHCGFTAAVKGGVPYFEEAELVLLCKKSFACAMTEEAFADRALLPACYPAGDYHRLFIGEITEVLKRA